MNRQGWISGFKVLGIFLLAILVMYPSLQGYFHIVKEKKLDGAVAYKSDVSFTWQGWWDGTWQIGKEEYLAEQFGLRSLFVRLHNEIDYRLFGKGHARNVVIGKEQYLYERDYILTYYGKDFQGQEALCLFIEKLKRVQNILNARGKTLIVVLAAGKGSFYPEFFPDEYSNWKRGPTNYETFIRLAADSGLNFIDFSGYFRGQKESSPYLIYPRYGIHWSHYAMTLAADSMTNYIEQKRSIRMNHLSWNSVRLQRASDTDYDIGSGLNLLSYLEGPKMAYPQVKVDQIPGRTKPALLVIADSFYWGIFNMGFSNLFSTSHFWYYNNEVYPEHYTQPTFVKDLDINMEVEKHDIIILMATEHNISGAGWGFADSFLEKVKQSE